MGLKGLMESARLAVRLAARLAERLAESHENCGPWGGGVVALRGLATCVYVHLYFLVQYCTVCFWRKTLLYKQTHDHWLVRFLLTVWSVRFLVTVVFEAVFCWRCIYTRNTCQAGNNNNVQCAFCAVQFLPCFWIFFFFFLLVVTVDPFPPLM